MFLNHLPIEKRVLDKICFQTAMFSRTYEQSKSKQRFYRNFLLHSQHYSSVKIRRIKIVLNTAAAEVSCCFTSMSGVSFGAEMYDTNNKGSLDLSQYKKQACLNL